MNRCTFSIDELTAVAISAQPLLTEQQARTRAHCALMVLACSLTASELSELSRRCNATTTAQGVA